MTQFQTRIQEAFQQAQSKATARANEARKVLETLGDRAQAEFKVFVQTAQKGSSQQLHAIGVELEKLGKKLQEIAAKSAPQPEVTVNGQTPPAAHPN